jgi:biopolymer transport protein ExbB/TolQ
MEQALLDIAEALRYPVLILALAALAWVLVEIGAFGVELLRRRKRDFGRLSQAAAHARAALQFGDRETARGWLAWVATSAPMAQVMNTLVEVWGHPGAEDRMAKALADFDFRSMKRLERTRFLVRAGPALGLMGTLIPLSPALAALGEGDVRELSEGLRVAFGITVIGILIGMLAFGLSLIRNRIYGQDHSDLEYVAAVLTEATPAAATNGSAPHVPGSPRSQGEVALAAQPPAHVPPDAAGQAPPTEGPPIQTAG